MATSGRPARHCAAAPPAPCATDEKAPLLPRALAPPKGGGGGLPVADSCGAAPAGRAARAVLVGLLHIVCSAGLILFNKYVLSPERFPFAVCLTTLHMFAAFVLSFLLHKVAPQLFPSADSVFGTGSEWLGRLGGLAFFLPIGACCAVSVVCANSAYNYASVSFLQMVKESVVLWVYLLGVLAGLEPLRMQCLAVLAFVTCSAALAVCSGGGFRWPGLLLQFASSFTQALQAVLMNRLMTHYHGPKVDPLSLVLGTAPVVLCLLLPVSFSLWDAEVHARLASWWRLLLLNASAAFALQAGRPSFAHLRPFWSRVLERERGDEDAPQSGRRRGGRAAGGQRRDHPGALGHGPGPGGRAQGPGHRGLGSGRAAREPGAPAGPGLPGRRGRHRALLPHEAPRGRAQGGRGRGRRRRAASRLTHGGARRRGRGWRPARRPAA